ncbi:MAG: aminoacyl-histidine dipeptidase, partial [Schleiferiaceae bacterium]|nr:aminoacyl-histidine dipeptidase [Schleiferiaceae bacterium]
MSQEVRSLEPKALWNNFADLNSVPRPSKKEERVIAFIKKFGEDLGLPTVVDHVGNVIIKKPASPGNENKTTIVLQSHLDMVCQKNNDTDFDFDTQGIDMYVEDGWVKAKGTTLGADNGLGVASIMTLLASTDINHPPLEALFTIDEETGMTGAQGLQGGMLDAKIMLNLDTEDDDELTIGCAGGVDVTVTGRYTFINVGDGFVGYEVAVKGLSGGHSGMDIHKGKGNANKLMNRILWGAPEDLELKVAEINGGGLRNAIPRESVAQVAVKSDKVEALKTYVNAVSEELLNEFKTTDPDLVVELNETSTPERAMARSDQKNLLNAIYACPLGIYRMSPDMEDLVQTSNNIARVIVSDGGYTVMCLTRGSVDSEKMDLANSIKSTFSMIGAKVEFSGAYPGWEPKPQSDIVDLMANLYREMFDK